MLGRYLVEEQGWTSAYFTPDVNHPFDGNQEHPYTFKTVSHGGKYYGIPINDKIINYRPMDPPRPLFKEWAHLGLPKEPTKADRSMVERIKIVTFGFGSSFGGDHTWLLSRGFVYEVHWTQIGPELYEKSPFETFHAASGVIVFPSDALWY